MKEIYRQRFGDVRFLLILLGFQALFVYLVGGILAVPSIIVAKYAYPHLTEAAKNYIDILSAGDDPIAYYGGIIASILFMPLDIAVLYYIIDEYKRRGRVEKAFDRAVSSYPVFFAWFSAFLWISSFAAFLIPILAAFAYYRARGKMDIWAVIIALIAVAYMYISRPIILEGGEIRRIYFVVTNLLIPLLLWPFAGSKKNASPEKNGQ